MSDTQPSPRRYRRPLRRIAVALAVLVMGLGLALVAARLYYNDERLRQIVTEQASAALHVPVRLSGLHLDFGSELTLEGLVVGPPPGFTRDLLTIGRVHLAWRLRPLLSKAVVIPDLTVSNVTVCLEENEHGQNIDIFATPSEPTAPPPAAPPSKLEQPDIPLRVELAHVALEHLRAEMVSPAMTASIDEVGLTGSVSAEHRALTLDAWAGLGSRDDTATTSHVRFVQQGTALESTQRFGVTLATTGFGDVRVGLDLAATTTMREPYALPPLSVTATARAKVDLVSEQAAIEDTHLTIDRTTHLDLGAHVTQMLENPSLAFDATRGVIDVDALAPYVEAFVPGEYHGTIDFTLAPTSVSGTAAPDVTTLATGMTVKADKVGVRAMGYDVGGLDAALTGSLTNGIVAAHLDMHAGTLAAPQGRVSELRATTELTAPVAPFMTASADGPVELAMHAHLGHAQALGNSADGTGLDLHVTGTAAMLLGGRAEQPLLTRAHLTVDKAAAQGSSVRGVDVTADVRQDDLAANSVQLSLAAVVAETRATLPQGSVKLPRTTLGVRLTRHLDTIDLRALDFALGDLTGMHANGHIDGALGSKPRFKDVSVALADTHIERLIALLPQSLRPPGSPSGTASGHATLDGTVPYVELTKAAQAPYIPQFGDVWGETIAAYDLFAKQWATRFDKGMPFSADIAFDVADLAYDTADAALQGGKLHSEARLGAHGPEMHAVFEAATLATTVTMNDARFELGARVAGTHAESRLQGHVKKLDTEALPTPLADTTFDFATSYDLDGNVSSSFSAEVPSLGARVATQAKLRSPLDAAAARSWEQRGLPGVAVEIGWDADMHNDAHLNLGGGVAMTGGLASHGSFEIDRGIAVLTGALNMRKLSVKANGNEIDDISGDVPIDVRVAFDGRDDATPLARDLPFAGGTASLITEASATEDRPIYYASMRHYHRGRGLTIRRVKSGPYVVDDIVFDGGLSAGRLGADWLSLHILGGDIVGNMALRFTSNRAVAMIMDLKVSNIDASNFSQLHLEPGPDSELDADMHMTFTVAPHLRDLAFDMNVTHVGSKTLDRFLQLLDPDDQNVSLQRTRGQLGFVRIENLATWVRYENLNMDIDVRPFLHIPFTDIGIPNIDHQLLRRYSITEQLDYYLQPMIDTTLAPLLGWNRAN